MFLIFIIHRLCLLQNQERIERRLKAGWRKINQTINWLNPGPNKRDSLARFGNPLNLLSKNRKLKVPCGACGDHHLISASYHRNSPQLYEPTSKYYACDSDDDF